MAQSDNTRIDPVCGMTVDPKTAAGSRSHGGTTYYFCSPACKKQFDAAPERFASGAASGGGKPRAQQH